MRSLKELYRIGKGPSSSHTIGPERACKLFLSENPQADSFVVRLYGSLAKTGEGHGTDAVIRSALPNVTVEFDKPTALQIDGETIVGVTSYRARSAALVKAGK